MMMAAIVTQIFPGALAVLLMIAYVAIIIYFVWLAGRFVRAVEKIADKFEKYSPTESEKP